MLDVGCNAGFYSIEMKRRGAARVLGIDSDERYLARARLAAEIVGADVEFRRMSVYQLPQLGGTACTPCRARGRFFYYRHFYMGLLREDGTPKLALRAFAGHTPALGICQWFHFEDHRLDAAVRRLRDLGVRYLRTGLSWADSLRPNAQAWFDRQMRAVEPFDVTLTLCFTPESEGVRPHHTSPPRDVTRFADFCAEQVRRYG